MCVVGCASVIYTSSLLMLFARQRRISDDKGAIGFANCLLVRTDLGTADFASQMLVKVKSLVAELVLVQSHVSILRR